MEDKTDNSVEQNKTSKSLKFYSPLVRSIAKKEGVSFDELDNISGSGLNGRVNKNDISSCTLLLNCNAPASILACCLKIQWWVEPSQKFKFENFIIT